MTLRDPEPGEYRSFKLVDRKAIPKRWKAEAYQRTNGRCYVCQKTVPLAGPDVQYDHRTPLWLDDTAHKVENIFPICTTPCHRDKTANEAPIRAKVLRNMKREAGVKKITRKINSPGFGARNRKFNGQVGPTKQEERRLSGRATSREDGQLRERSNPILPSTSMASGRGEL